MFIKSPTTYSVYSLGDRSKTNIHFGPFRSGLQTPPCLIHYDFLVTPPECIHLQPFVWNDGGLTFILYFWWVVRDAPGVPRKLLDKKNRQLSNRVPFIHFELPGRLSGGRTCEMIYLTSVSSIFIISVMGVFAACERVAFRARTVTVRSHFDLKLTQKMLRLWLADWMFCNHRSIQPCLHTFFIVFRRFFPHRFHTFLVNMIRHPHGIHPPVLYTFVIAIFR